MKVSRNIIKVLALTLAMASAASFGYSVKADSGIATIKGSSRVETSIESSKLVDSKIMVVASAYSFADSLSAYNIASSYNAKLILVSNSTDLTKLLNDVKPEKVYLIGGESSLGGKVVESIQKNVSDVVRIAGSNRYETNEKTLKEAKYTRVGVADGRNYPDALAASCLLKSKGLGLKLVDGSRPYSESREVVYTYGGTNSVKQNGGKRIAGSNRYKTSEAISSELGNGVEKVAVTTGENYADALSAINVVNSGGKVSLVLLKDLSLSQEQYLANIPSKYLIGGQLSKDVVDEIISGKNLKNDNKVLLRGARSVFKCDFVDVSGNYLSNSEFEVYKNDLAEIAKYLPSGYKVVSDRDELNNLKADGSVNKVYVARNDVTVLRNQNEYNKYIFNGLKNGIDCGEVIVGSSVVPNKNLERIVDGMGFTLKENLVYGNNGFNKMNIKMSVRQEYYTKEKYNKDEYRENIENVEALIQDSGARSLKTNREKAVRFAQYLKIKYPYNNQVHDHIRARSPYAITKYGTGVCESFTYTYNQAMMLMGIPAYQVEGTNKKGVGHMEAMVYCNGNWEVFNVSGYTNWDRMDHDDYGQITGRDISQRLVVIENDPVSQGLINVLQQELGSLYRL